MLRDPDAPHLAATRASYDRVAVDYADQLRDELAGKPVDRALLRVFAELVLADDGGPVLEVGCGSGRITAHLSGLGLPARGIDLSPAMIEVARRDHPGLIFEVGDLTRLDEQGLAGIVAWYSLIHTPPVDLAAAIGRIGRAVRPGGHLLAAYQVGDDEPVVLAHGYGHPVELTAYRLSPQRMSERVTAAGFDVIASTVRAPVGRERTPQAYLLARRRSAESTDPTSAASCSATSAGRSKGSM